MAQSSRVIFGCSGLELTPSERQLFTQVKPWGFILFARNIASPTQVKKLVDDLKNSVEREDAVILIDQEGGRVSRLPESHWRIPPSPTYFADMYLRKPELALQAMRLNYRLIGHDLKSLGINVNCAPMVDIPQRDASAIVTERAYGVSSDAVIALAQSVIDGLKDTGVAPVVKHAPGHGRATSDSHHFLPTVTASQEALVNADFKPFKALCQESMFMSAHIVFAQIDKRNPATQSADVIQNIIREHIGFDGLLMTDDINMKALQGDVTERVSSALSAGCDVALHCNGNLAEMTQIGNIISPLEGDSLRRAEKAEKQAFAKPSTIDFQQTELELDNLYQLLKR
jgi:beta-N-acetylhexosaminidase